jgi:hypothetical protein
LDYSVGRLHGVLVGERVVHELTVLLTADQLCVLHNIQMLGNWEFRNLKAIGNLAHSQSAT